MKKKFVVRKYVIAENAKEALELEGKQAPDECFLADDKPGEDKIPAIGFQYEPEEEIIIYDDIIWNAVKNILSTIQGGCAKGANTSLELMMKNY